MGTGEELTRVRPPRTQITIDVEEYGQTVQKELPFVVGVLGDYSGDATKPPAKLRDRKLVDVSRDNFDQVLAGMNVGLNVRVENKLQEDDTEIPVSLQFKSMDDFQPAAVANQIDPLRKLMELREKLMELRGRTDRSDDLEEALNQILKETDSALESGGAGADRPDAGE